MKRDIWVFKYIHSPGPFTLVALFGLANIIVSSMKG